MDNVTHSLTALALSRAGLDRFCPRAVWLLLLSANAPDVDVAVAPAGALRYLEIHRGYSHSLVAMPFLAALTVVVVAAVSRKKLPWCRAWLLCVAGLTSHLLLDWTNSYGIRLFLPFSSRWFHLDLNGLFDAWILAALLLAAIWPFFSRLVNREIGDRSSPAGRRLAIFALAFFASFDVGRATLHNRGVAQLESRLYDGQPPIQAAALPEPFNPLRWTAIVETADSYRLSTINPLGQFNLESAATFYKPPVTPSLEAAQRVDPFRYFLYFSRFPVWSIEPLVGTTTSGTRLDLTDLRFGTPGSGSFHCVGYENKLNQLIEKQFTYGSGADIGWDGTRGTDSAQ